MPVNGGGVLAESPFIGGVIVGDVEIGTPDTSRNGFRETGRGGTSRGERSSTVVGEGAPNFRKGLFDDKLRERP